MADIETIGVKITLPGIPNNSIIECNGVLVAIGANGAGKTRFGVWLENSDPQRTHRISAQKSLAFPKEIQPVDLKRAEAFLRVGDEYADEPGRRRAVRWNGWPETHTLDDYLSLTRYLFSEEHDKSIRYRHVMQNTTQYNRPPETKLDIIKRIWESTLPKRELRITGAKVQACRRGSEALYDARDLSDGERVIFYLIGQALSAVSSGMLIIDEPELHLHRAIQGTLWDAIEAERPDCTFVYLTHDLDFAASRKGATKIWLREYENEQWEWKLIPETEDFSEPLFLEILGSRKPILFVEGEKGSLDYFIYGKLYPDRSIIPCGSCEHVIHATASFREMHQLHSNSCRGFVDFDGRTAGDVEWLRRREVDVLPFGQIENLLLLEPVLRYIAKTLSLDEASTMAAVRKKIFGALSRDRERVVSRLTAIELEASFRRFDASVQGKAALAAAFENVHGSISPASIYERWENEVGEVIVGQDYLGALKYYPNKGLAAEIGTVFKTPVQDLILRKLRSNEAIPILDAMRAALPQI
jgi:energy-coupling factor transporter ATP-binding protein EcfA2